MSKVLSRYPFAHSSTSHPQILCRSCGQAWKSRGKAMKSARSGNCLWFVTKLHDGSGGTTACVSERVALELTGLLNKAEFVRKHKYGLVSFPLFANLRVARQRRDFSGVGATQPKDGGSTCVSHIIEDVEPTMWLQPLQLQHMRRSCRF
jgi:hypothetical protein